ncbi:MAG: hypothetical protein ABI137_06070, partial [Antricoccus sp.]
GACLLLLFFPDDFFLDELVVCFLAGAFFVADCFVASFLVGVFFLATPVNDFFLGVFLAGLDLSLISVLIVETHAGHEYH